MQSATQTRLFIDLSDDVNGSDAAIFAGIEQADLDALFRQRHPRIDIGGKVVEANQNIVALAPGQTGGDIAQGERGGADEGDLLRLGLEQPGGQSFRACGGCGDERWLPPDRPWKRGARAA